jgi:hypothetical protein
MRVSVSIGECRHERATAPSRAASWLNGPFSGLFSAETEHVACTTDLLLRHRGRHCSLPSNGLGERGVFVPADRPPRSKVECSNAAGDLVVAADGNGGLDSQLVASVADGPWTPLVGVDNCGALAVAPDGTAALVAPAVGPGMAMIVRRSGGRFGPPLLLGDSPETPALAVAVAPGG